MIYFKLVSLFFFNYIYFYLMSLLFIFGIFWYWLIYADRLHLREFCRKIGTESKKYLKTHIDTTLIEKYLFYQLNTLSEGFAGFTNGLIFDEPTVNVTLMVDKEVFTQYISKEIETQTDPIEPEIKIVEKEIIKEVVVEKEVEVEKEVIREILVVKEIQVPVSTNGSNISNVKSESGYEIFGPKTKVYTKPSMEEDNKMDCCTMIESKPKRVRIKQKI